MTFVLFHSSNAYLNVKQGVILHWKLDKNFQICYNVFSIYLTKVSKHLPLIFHFNSINNPFQNKFFNFWQVLFKKLTFFRHYFIEKVAYFTAKKYPVFHTCFINMKKLPTLGSFLALRISTRIVQNPKKLPTLADFFDKLIFTRNIHSQTQFLIWQHLPDIHFHIHNI